MAGAVGGAGCGGKAEDHERPAGRAGVRGARRFHGHYRFQHQARPGLRQHLQQGRKDPQDRLGKDVQVDVDRSCHASVLDVA